MAQNVFAITCNESCDENLSYTLHKEYLRSLNMSMLLLALVSAVQNGISLNITHTLIVSRRVRRNTASDPNTSSNPNLNPRHNILVGPMRCFALTRAQRSNASDVAFRFTVSRSVLCVLVYIMLLQKQSHNNDN